MTMSRYTYNAIHYSTFTQLEHALHSARKINGTTMTQHYVTKIIYCILKQIHFYHTNILPVRYVQCNTLLCNSMNVKHMIVNVVNALLAKTLLPPEIYRADKSERNNKFYV